MLFRTPELGDAERAVIQRIEDSRAELRWILHEPRRWEGSLRRLSMARAIQGSNSIEGYDAELDDAAAIVAGEEPLDAGEEARLALAGYCDAMTYVLSMAADPEFAYDTRLIKSLHFLMTNYDSRARPGNWRAGSSFVHDEESGQLVYEGADVGQVPAFVRALTDVLNSDSGDSTVVRAAMAHLNLVMVHPFRDGNGRMARCLQSLVLARDGVLSPVFMSIEEYLGRNTRAYYDVLGEVGNGSWQPERDARPWLRFVLTAHLRQAQTMVRRMHESDEMWTRLEQLTARHKFPPRTVFALFDAALGLRVRNVTYRSYFDDAAEEVNEQMASRDLRALADKGLLVARGERRGRHYVAADEVRGLRKEQLEARTIRVDEDPFAQAP